MNCDANHVFSRGKRTISRADEAGSYLRLIDFVYLSPLGLRIIEKKKARCENALQG